MSARNADATSGKRGQCTPTTSNEEHASTHPGTNAIDYKHKQVNTTNQVKRTTCQHQHNADAVDYKHEHQ